MTNKLSKIYILQVGDFFKIGYTTNSVEKRVKQLQTGSPDKITIKYIFESNYKMSVERSLHRLFSHKRISGEFFDLSVDDLNKIPTLCSTIEKALQKSEYR